MGEGEMPDQGPRWSERQREELEGLRAQLKGRDPHHPGHGAIAHPWPDGSERWGDARGENAVHARLLGIEWSLQDVARDLEKPLDWSAGWDPAPDIAIEVAAAREAIAAAVTKVRGAREGRRGG
jgi:hypothetical protein